MLASAIVLALLRTQFLGKPILVDSVLAFHSTLGLRRVGTDDIDAQFLTG
jgi:hypothetical protein